MVLVWLLDLYSFVILAAVVVSWTQAPPTHPIIGLLSMLTEPVLSPMRRALPDIGGLDFSPLVLLIGIRFVRGIVLSIGPVF